MPSPPPVPRPIEDDRSPVRLPDDALSTWIVSRAAATPARSAKHRLVEEARRLIRATVMLDPDPPGGPATAAVDDLAAALASLVDRMEALPALAGSPATAGADDARLLERSGISGQANPLAAPLHLGLEGDRVQGWATYGPPYEGPPGTVHGGFVAAAFDDLLGVAQTISGSAGFTGTLTIRMRRPTPLGRRIDYTGGLTAVEGRKIRAWGTASHAGEVLAEAEGVFVTPRPRTSASM